MRKIILTISAAALISIASAFSLHKFYVAIYHVNYAKEKKMVQITSRVFTDDLNDALGKKYKTKSYLGEKSESAHDIEMMTKYFSENLKFNINGAEKPLEYLSHEFDNNVIVGYFRISGVSKISSLEVKGKILIEHVTDQQNIIQTNINGKKETQLLTVGDTTAEFKY